MNIQSLKFPLGVIFLIAFILFTPRCKKDKDEIPNVYVNFYINVTSSTQYIELNNIGGYVYLTGGVRGIIVYRNSVDEFMAYERNCPYQPQDECATVKIDNSAVIAVDTCCGSKFLIIDGSIVNGPATRQLKQYQTTFDGVSVHVFN